MSKVLWFNNEEIQEMRKFVRIVEFFLHFIQSKISQTLFLRKQFFGSILVDKSIYGLFEVLRRNFPQGNIVRQYKAYEAHNRLLLVQNRFKNTIDSKNA